MSIYLWLVLVALLLAAGLTWLMGEAMQGISDNKGTWRGALPLYTILACILYAVLAAVTALVRWIGSLL